MTERAIANQLVFLEPPAGYAPRMHVAACFCEYKDKFLFLLRQPGDSSGSTWGIPGGKLDSGETAMQAVIRELQEETGITIQEHEVQQLQTVYIRYPKGDFTYTMFRTALQLQPQVTLNPDEHTEARWLTLSEALKLPLIPGEDECIFLAYGIKP